MQPEQKPSSTPPTQTPTAVPPPPDIQAQTAAPAAPTPQAASEGDPTMAISIVGLILAFIAPLFGLIIGIVARSKSKKLGYSNKLALAAIILSIFMMTLGPFFFLFFSSL